MTKNKKGYCEKCKKDVKLKYVKDPVCNYYRCAECGNDGEHYELNIYDYDFDKDD